MSYSSQALPRSQMDYARAIKATVHKTFSEANLEFESLQKSIDLQNRKENLLKMMEASYRSAQV
jgi:hypothetical protein